MRTGARWFWIAALVVLGTACAREDPLDRSAQVRPGGPTEASMPDPGALPACGDFHAGHRAGDSACIPSVTMSSSGVGGASVLPPSIEHLRVVVNSRTRHGTTTRATK